MASEALQKLRDPSLLVTAGLVAGEWRESTTRVFQVYEPSSGTVLGDCTNLGRQDFLDAIDSAERGTIDFYQKTAKERGLILRTWFDLVLDNIEDLSTILSLENGKTYAEARAEVTYAASFISWFAEEATRSYGDTIPSSYTNTTVFTYKEPVGVCAIITPWNFPAAMITRKVAPALAAGCSVVIKPPSETPYTALALARLALVAGVPTDCIHVVPTKDREASMELATNPRVKKLSFTGSTGVGKILAQAAAGTMKRVSMELGGNAPFIVFDDADLEVAVEAAMACKFRCSGQTCVCANRLLVHEKVKDEFVALLVKRVQNLNLGRGIDAGVTQGPLVNAAAVNKVDAHVRDAISKGAILHTGGKKPSNLKGYFYEPTIISNANAEMEVAVDETFGPLAAVFSFRSEDEAVAMANSTEYGLSGYFFSQNIGRIMRVARRLECGMIGVNTGLISAAETPFGGVKESGIGREGSKYGLAEYQNIKAITIGNLQIR
ncbi:probable UGA2 - succinate semialdehyde dehydrogenase [Cephalotrichum gorgonifer]|uniref:Succinate-semialdehyde dehydrogenase, mitochondrial n=1 Tax=Cephalotrichum gorgonifer TaxID=2041049 RepID=A0AAE8T0I3_9PEZI|nr:probable UGA2 - succinate semialdehyde dehydrogenase [Cephalotrichum gorgonifer]